jgi:hypothetical protein
VDPLRDPGYGAGEHAEPQPSWFRRDPLDPDPPPYREPTAGSGLHARADGPVGPRSGQPLPPLPPVPEDPAGYPTEALDREALRRTMGGLQRLGDGVYRSRRPALAAVLAVLTVVFEIPAIRVLLTAFSHISINGTVAGTFLVLALPMFSLGLYALAGGAAAAPGQGVRAWLRTPLAYLPLALILFVAAAVAA